MSINNPKETTIRALIVNEYNNKILTCYYKKYKTYMTAEGHKENNESDIDTLSRELYEELGATKVEIVKYLKVLYTPADDTLSRYYLVNINKVDLKHRALEKGEIEDGLQVVYQDLDEIIRNNKQQYNNSLYSGYGLPYLIKREVVFFKGLKEEV